jgi:methylthioribose-1-phosphate isomerase
MSGRSIVRTVEWVREGSAGLVPGKVRILDQTRLPGACDFIETADIEVVFTAIRTLQVRGAPAIGIAAAMGVAAAMQTLADRPAAERVAETRRLADRLAAARPTAVNLFWALDRMKAAAQSAQALSAREFAEALAREAQAIRDEDAVSCRAIGEFGSALLRDGDTALTHCNAGALAVSELGTALAPIYVANEQGKRVSVIADETRPLLQGSRLTAWELQRAGIEVEIICDNTAAQVMKEGRVHAVLVGADRIAANGDAANKIGTYGLAVLARAHEIPFYVLAPTSTFDARTPDGAAIPIEQRSGEEVVCGFGRRTAPENARVYAPAFDVTPAAMISAIVCEQGVLRPVNRATVADALARADAARRSRTS